MKKRDLANLLNRAAAGFETPGDLSETDKKLLAEDLVQAAREIDDSLVPNQNGYMVMIKAMVTSDELHQENAIKRSIAYLASEFMVGKLVSKATIQQVEVAKVEGVEFTRDELESFGFEFDEGR